MTNWLGNGRGWREDAPVFDCDWPPTEDGSTDKGSKLPNVWVTVQMQDPTETKTGRNCICHYTPDEDPDGWQALRHGGDYYEEGMSCNYGDEHERRVMCFQAAELLYLHASAKGNRYADLCLGYVYSYDRCEGRYWHSEKQEFSCDEHAYKHYRKAAEADLAEACYKLGDLLREGRGCTCDPAEAFAWFMKAYELGTSERPVVWGSAALRLGRAYEEGEGCEQSFESARNWYERATTGLGIAVRGGERWYQGALRHAERGLTRTKQELYC